MIQQLQRIHSTRGTYLLVMLLLETAVVLYIPVDYVLFGSFKQEFFGRLQWYAIWRVTGFALDLLILAGLWKLFKPAVFGWIAVFFLHGIFFWSLDPSAKDVATGFKVAAMVIVAAYAAFFLFAIKRKWQLFT